MLIMVLVLGTMLFPVFVLAQDEEAVVVDNALVPELAAQLRLGMTRTEATTIMGREADNQDSAVINIGGKEYELVTLKWWLDDGETLIAVHLILDNIIKLQLTNADGSLYLRQDSPILTFHPSELELPYNIYSARSIIKLCGYGEGVARSRAIKLPKAKGSYRLRWASYNPPEKKISPLPNMRYRWVIITHVLDTVIGESVLYKPRAGEWVALKGKEGIEHFREPNEHIGRTEGRTTITTKVSYLEIYSGCPWVMIVEFVPK